MPLWDMCVWHASGRVPVRLLTCMDIFTVEAPNIWITIKSGFLWCHSYIVQE